MTKPPAAGTPSTVKALERAMRTVAKEREVNERRLRVVISNTVAAQMMPAGVIKGGTGLKLRVGEGGSRFTTDLDTALAEPMDVFVEEFAAALATGWGEDGSRFTGRLVRMSAARPPAVPTSYVMQPFEVKLDYNGKAWGTVELEVGHDEINCTERPDRVIADDIVDLFRVLHLPEPSAVAVISLEHQIAQKIHAMTYDGSERAHDLVDVQLFVEAGTVDIRELRTNCERLFRYRATHKWPAKVVAGESWTGLYAEAALGTGAREDLDQAVDWVNDYIETVSRATEQQQPA